MSLLRERVASDSQRLAFNLATLGAGSGTLRCRMLRVLGEGLLSQPRFLLYAETGGANEESSEVFLAAASRVLARRGSVKPYYVLSASEHEEKFSRRSPHYMGRLTGNLLSTQYTLHAPASGGPAGPRDGEEEVLLDVKFRKPTDAPRMMQVTLPSRRMSASAGGWARQAWGDGEAVLGATRLVNRQPEYDAGANVYSMDFHGRVCRASAKNFQLVAADRNFEPLPGAELRMQFGRAREANNFHLDAGSPLSPLQAFALALSVFDGRPAEGLRLYY